MAKKKLVLTALFVFVLIGLLCGFFLIRKGKLHWETSATIPSSKTFADRSYYSSESELKLICLANIDSKTSDKTPKTICISIQNEQKSEVFNTSVPCQGVRTSVPVSIKDYAPGTYSALTQFLDSDGKAIWENTCKFTKLPPAPSTEAKLDYDNETILVDGKPFFPIGFLIVGKVWSKETIEKLSSAGFNCLVRWENMMGKRSLESFPEIAESLDRANAAGIKVFEAPFAFGPDFNHARYSGELATDKGNDIRKGMLSSVSTPMKTWKTHPAIIGYYGLDEPDEDLYPFTHHVYDTLKTQDPYRLIYSTNWMEWTEECYEAYDVVGRQTYWMPLAKTFPNSAAEISIDNRKMMMLAERAHRPFIGTVQACWREEVRKITPQEMRCSYYLPIINGAKGLLIFWYVEEDMHPAEWKASAEIAGELSKLSPILLKKSPPQQIACTVNSTPNKAEPIPNETIDIVPDFKPIGKSELEQIKPPVIQALAKNIPDGEILIVANSDSNPYQATFNISTVGKETQIEDFFNPSKQYKLSGTTFTDNLEGNAVRVYRVKKSNRTKEDEPVRVSIGACLMNAAASQNEVASSTNLLLNGSFEEATYFGKPDAWFVNPWTDSSAVNTRVEQRQVKMSCVDGEYAARSGWWDGWEDKTFAQIGKLDLSKDYVFSIYLKADKPNVPFTLYFEKPSNQSWRGAKTPKFSEKIIVGTEWKRYTLPIPLKQKDLQGESVFQVSVEANGVCNVWADAAQLEVGLTPTPFKRDAYRATPIGDAYSRKAILGKE